MIDDGFGNGPDGTDAVLRFVTLAPDRDAYTIDVDPGRTLHDPDGAPDGAAAGSTGRPTTSSPCSRSRRGCRPSEPSMIRPTCHGAAQSRKPCSRAAER